MFLREPDSWYNPSRPSANWDAIPCQAVNVRSATVLRHVCQLVLGSCFIKRREVKVWSIYDINMLISYKVACIKQDVAEAVRKKVQDSSGLFIPSCFFSSHLTTRIENLVRQMTSDSYMVLRWSSFKKVKPNFTNKKWKPEEVQGYGIFIEMFEILLLFVVSTL